MVRDRKFSHLAASRGFRFGLLFLLAMTEAVPVGLLLTAMPVLLRRSGASMAEMSVIPLVMSPWALSALWAPLVDRWGARSRFGRYRAWLFVTHPILLLTFVLASFVNIPALVTSNRTVGIPALLWLSVVSATADTASHGLVVNLLSPDERGLGNGVQNAGVMMGTLVGGGLIVMLVSRFGWQPALLFVAALVLLPLFGVALYQEAPVDSRHAITLREALAFFRRPRIWRWLVLLTAVWALPLVPFMPFQSLLVDRGLELTEIGFLVGMLGNAVGALGGALGGLVVTRLGRERAFYALNLLCVACLGLSLALATRATAGRPMLYAAVMLSSAGSSAGATVLFVMMMDRSRGHIASTDYSVQNSLMQLWGFLGASTGGFLAERFSSAMVYILVPLLHLGVLAISSQVMDRRDFQPSPYPVD